ncbi:unnamed protein product [Pleuronectes platessa]|uniref:Uncharacterized protein n=1 Tax=Pleuronectes platessa TaxID=8262 RepID=A0A9N7TK89_PLEPL|nr:unnamed protein product [Pleuronectes platessa]
MVTSSAESLELNWEEKPVKLAWIQTGWKDKWCSLLLESSSPTAVTEISLWEDDRWHWAVDRLRWGGMKAISSNSQETVNFVAEVGRLNREQPHRKPPRASAVITEEPGGRC